MSAPAEFAIFRVAKHKTLGAVASLAGHALRDRPTLNADPARTPDNRVLAGADLADGAAVAAAIGKRVDAATHRRPDSVLCLEVLVGVSPDWAAKATTAQWDTWRERSHAWLVEEFGRENVVFLAEHRDEKTPHLTAFVTPIRPDGRLSAAHWTGGGDHPGQRLSEMQDRHHAAVAGAGLRRGIRGSKAKHQDVQRFHGAATNPPVPKIPAVEAPRLLDVATAARRDEWAQGQTKRVRKPVRDLARRAGMAEIERTRAEGQRATAAALERQRDKLREEAARLRGLPLEDVLTKWHLARDAAGSTKTQSQWRDAGGQHRITVTGTRWHDHTAERGGGGAIDLVMHLDDCTPKAAISALASRFGGETAEGAAVAHAVAKARQEAAEAAKQPPPPFVPPDPSPGLWEPARRFLTRERRLSEGVVDEAHRRGDLYADSRGNVVALQRDLAGAVVGAELRGTSAARFVGVAKGSRPDQGAWCLRVGQGGPLVLAESVVDALSLADLRGPRQPAVYASTAGNAGAQANHPIVSAAVAAKVAVHVAADNDDQGRRFLARYTERWGNAVRDALPQGVKDWNDALRRKVVAGWRSAWERVRGGRGDGPAPAPEPAEDAPRPP